MWGYAGVRGGTLRACDGGIVRASREVGEDTNLACGTMLGLPCWRLMVAGEGKLVSLGLCPKPCWALPRPTKGC